MKVLLIIQKKQTKNKTDPNRDTRTGPQQPDVILKEKQTYAPDRMISQMQKKNS